MGFSVTAVGKGRFILFGGFAAPDAFFIDFGKWVPQLPSLRLSPAFGHVAAYFNGVLYVFGGSDGASCPRIC
jgi:hypothetical protein